MKKIIIVLVIGVLLSFTTTKKEKTINWVTFEEAVAAQKKSPKKIFVDSYTSWCGWCKKMDQTTFSNPDVIKYMNENYYAIKFDAEGNDVIELNGKTYSNPNFVPNKSGRNGSHELSRFFGIRSFPTVVFLDENAQMITPVPGYQTPQKIELYLKFIASDDYKEIKTKEQWTEYSANFVPTFSE